MHRSRAREGTVPFSVPSVGSGCETFYKIFGDLSCGAPPLVVIHGGPGGAHDYLLAFATLWPRHGIPVVFYDQIGCGASTHLPQTAGNESLWQMGLFLDELDNLLDSLHLRDGPGFHLLGQSWGGRIAAEYATRRPKGLRRLILASGLASTELADRGKRLLIQQLNPEVRDVLLEEERKGNWESEAYKEAQAVYFKTYVCRSDPFPPDELKPTLKAMIEAKYMHDTLYGPNPMTIMGTLRGWTCIPRLSKITATTLVYNGDHDTSHDIATAPFFELIPRVRWITFPNAGHMCHMEEKSRERVLNVVAEFLKHE